MRGEPDRAEKILRQSLVVFEELGHQVGIAKTNVNLGFVYLDRGDQEEARRFWTTACQLFAKVGMKPELAELQTWIDGLPNEPRRSFVPGLLPIP